MALTPEDVVNKRFQPTKFREGYDQDEVDDFLDEVVVELRRLGQENEELRQRLIGSESRIAELQRSGGAAASAPSAPTPVVVPEPAPAPAPVVAAPAPEPVAAAPSYAAPAADLDTSNTTNLLQLARRLHEEHVKEGIEKRDSLISEGQAKADTLVSEGQAKADTLISESNATAQRIVSEAEAKQKAQIAQLDQERAVLEHRIDELRTFEREYRQKLKGYIESQLRELDSAGGTPAGVGASSDSSDSGFQGVGGN